MSRRGPDLGARLTALGRAVSLADGRIDAAALAPAQVLLARAATRRRLAPERTVVALAGGTGSGKSTLFNAMVGEPLAPTGVRRPTTDRPRAAVWPAEPDAATDDVGALLDDLQVPDRHQLSPSAGAANLAGLVLVDLPDFDSTADAHRREAERMVAVVDMFVWVLDPQKYADAAVHERYLRPLASHRDVMVVVLNQADRLDRRALDACRADLARLLAADGLDRVPVYATSALSGDGLPALRAALADRVRTSTVAVARLHADVDAAVAALSPLCAGSPNGGARRDAARTEEHLVSALGAAAGVGPVADAAARSYRMRARAQVGWPVTRWLGRLRPDPLRRLHLGSGSSGVTSRPAPSGAQRAQVSNAVRDLVAERTGALPAVWRTSASAAVAEREGAVLGALDGAVRSADLSADDRPRWWSGVRALQLMWFGAALTGLAWLTMLAVFAYFQLPRPDVDVGRAPLPTLLLIGGLVLGALTSVVARPFVNAGAARRRSRARRSLDAGVRDVARREILAPLAAELDVASAFCTALAAAHR